MASRFTIQTVENDLLLITNSEEGLQNAVRIGFLRSIQLKPKLQYFRRRVENQQQINTILWLVMKTSEIVNNYTYLGVKFSANGNFTNHKENLTEKTKRSFFAARRYLDFLKLPIHIINKLFNTLFFPILTYCSEVWGIYDKSDYSRWDKDSIEKTHIHFCKMCLGLNKRSPNVASRNELAIGRLSVNLQMTMNIFKFWIHLENQPLTASLNSA